MTENLPATSNTPAEGEAILSYRRQIFTARPGMTVRDAISPPAPA